MWWVACRGALWACAPRASLTLRAPANADARGVAAVPSAYGVVAARRTSRIAENLKSANSDHVEN